MELGCDAEQLMVSTVCCGLWSRTCMDIKCCSNPRASKTDDIGKITNGTHCVSYFIIEMYYIKWDLLTPYLLQWLVMATAYQDWKRTFAIWLVNHANPTSHLLYIEKKNMNQEVYCFRVSLEQLIFCHMRAYFINYISSFAFQRLPGMHFSSSPATGCPPEASPFLSALCLRLRRLPGRFLL